MRFIFFPFQEVSPVQSLALRAKVSELFHIGAIIARHWALLAGHQAEGAEKQLKTDLSIINIYYY